MHDGYDDDNPLPSHPGDDNNNQIQVEDDETDTVNEINGDDNENNSDDYGDLDPRKYDSNKFKTCSHYRQLTSRSIAVKAISTCVPDPGRVNCCTTGGDKSKFGAHDIEDLVQFGVQPNIKKGIAIYRDPIRKETSFGMTLSKCKSGTGNVTVNAIKPDGAAYREGSLEVDDTIMSVNDINISLNQPLETVTNRIRESNDPLLLDVYNGESPEMDVNEYSNESACPYYLSRALAKRAELIFCPYNYVLDPSIRAAMEIDIQDAIIVLDEAHNVEDTLRNLGSDTFKEFELIEMLPLLNAYATQWVLSKSRSTKWDLKDKEEDLDELMPDISHGLIILIEKVLKFLRDSKSKFTDDRIAIGVTKATAEYEQYKCPDDKEWQVVYYGPNGYGLRGKPTGCKNFFDEVDIKDSDIDTYESYIGKFEQFASRFGNDEHSQTKSRLADRIIKFVSSLCGAFRLSEHYYISSVVAANGNLDFATGSELNVNGRFKREPKKVVQCPQPGKSPSDPTPMNRVCNHPSCNLSTKGYVSHDEYCDGTMPRWESALVLNLLSPAVLLGSLSKQSHSLVLASGSLAPLQSLCAELNLLPPDLNPVDSKKTTVANYDNENDGKEEKSTLFINPFEEKFGRLQIVPKPLEANHVIQLDKQLLSIGIGHFPDGSQLTAKQSNYSQSGFHEKLGNAIANIIEAIPHGGVLGEFDVIYSYKFNIYDKTS